MAEIEKFYDTCRRLESGEIRVAEKKGDEWIVNTWIKEVILSGFRLGNLIDMSDGAFFFLIKIQFLPESFQCRIR